MNTSVLGRAYEQNIFQFSLYQLRDFTDDKHRTVDDLAYGGGGGMILKIEPLVRAVESIWNLVGKSNCLTIYFSPAGHLMNQRLIDSLSPSFHSYRHLILVCGHYEGIDHRFIEYWVDLEISLGNFVLTGGELPAVAFADALVRQLEGTLGNPEAKAQESFHLMHPLSQEALIEYPHYTRPTEFRGLKVPEILLKGNHEKIRLWRLQKSSERTKKPEPDFPSFLKSNHTSP